MSSNLPDRPRETTPGRTWRPTAPGCLRAVAVAMLLWIALQIPWRDLWALGNSLLLLAALVWSLFHPRPLVGAQPQVWRAAMWSTAVLVLPLYAMAVRSVSGDIAGPLGSLVGLTMAVVTAALPPLLLAGMLLFSGIGAMLGGHLGRRVSATDGARRGVGAWWLATLLLSAADLLVTHFGRPGADHWPLEGIPAATALIQWLWRRGDWQPEALAARWLQRLSRRLVLRRTWRGHAVVLDLRGLAVGALTAGVTLLAGASGMLMPLQFHGLANLIVVRRSVSDFLSPTTRRTASGYGRIVVLHMDTEARRVALTSGSEAAVQARLLRRLTPYKPLRVVVPLPMLDGAWTHGLVPPADSPLPPPDEARRNLADLGELADAMRESGSAVLAWPDIPDGMPMGHLENEPDYSPPQAQIDAGVARLAAAARESAEANLATVGTPLVPAVPTRFHGLPPVPWVLAAALSRQPLGLQRNGTQDEVVGFGQTLPTIGPNRILVDFDTRALGADLPHAPYGAVVRGDPLWQSKLSGQSRGEWQAPEEFFRDAVVFLDPLVTQTVRTPLGPEPRTEVQAHATATLLSRPSVWRLDPGWQALGTLLLALLMGGLCNRVPPLAGGLRAAALSLAIVAASAAWFVFGGVWWDTVVPLAAVVGTMLLTTQYTFWRERAGRQHNRALLERFVAPSVVEELLDDPEGKLGLRGRRQEVCVLFADMRGFTPFTARAEPETVVQVVNSYMTALTEALHAHGGMLDKYTGDGLMALFTATDGAVDVAQAVRAALAMAVAAEATSAELIARGLEPMRIGFGLHVGEAVVGLVGSPAQFNYTALGHAVVISARLQTLAAGGEVVVSEAVFQAVGHEFAVDPCDPVLVKGLADVVQAYRVRTKA